MMLYFLCLGNFKFPYACVSGFCVCLFVSGCSSQALFPGNEVAEIYHEMAKKVTLSIVFLVVLLVYSDVFFFKRNCAVLNFLYERFMLFTTLDTDVWTRLVVNKYLSFPFIYVTMYKVLGTLIWCASRLNFADFNK